MLKSHLKDLNFFYCVFHKMQSKELDLLSQFSAFSLLNLFYSGFHPSIGDHSKTVSVKSSVLFLHELVDTNIVAHSLH